MEQTNGQTSVAHTKASSEWCKPTTQDAFPSRRRAQQQRTRAPKELLVPHTRTHAQRQTRVCPPVQEKAVSAIAATASNGAAPPTAALSNGHHAPPTSSSAISATTPLGGLGGETKNAGNGAVVVFSAGGTVVGDGGGGLAQCLAELSGSVPDFPGLEEKAGALLVRKTKRTMPRTRSGIAAQQAPFSSDQVCSLFQTNGSLCFPTAVGVAFIKGEIP